MATTMTPGQSTTGTIHWGVREDGHLMQICGTSRQQRYSLLEVSDTTIVITCKRCLASAGPNESTL